MLTCFLKRILPFTLTLIIGAALGGFAVPFGARRETRRGVLRTEVYNFGYGEGHACKQGRFKRRELVAETKPLVILFKPDARLPDVFGELWWVQVTFGADGKVQAVEPFGGREQDTYTITAPQKWNAIQNAARQIQFTPETVDGIPVTVTRGIGIHLLPE